MQRLLSWLGSRLSRGRPAPHTRANPAVDPLRQAIRTPVVKPAPRQESKLVELRPELKGRIETIGPGKNVLVQNKVSSDATGTHDSLKILDESVLDGDNFGGVDPYNTGKFDRAANWSRTRK